MTTKTPDEIVSQVVLNNYGPEGDAELYEAATSDRQGAEPTTLDLLSAAAWMRDLDADGVRSLMVAAVEADRAQHARPENDGTIHAAVISELNERAENAAANGKDGNYAASAAAWVEAEPNEFWDTYAAPMLDDLEAAQR